MEHFTRPTCPICMRHDKVYYAPPERRLSCSQCGRHLNDSFLADVERAVVSVRRYNEALRLMEGGYADDLQDMAQQAARAQQKGGGK